MNMLKITSGKLGFGTYLAHQIKAKMYMVTLKHIYSDICHMYQGPMTPLILVKPIVQHACLSIHPSRL